MTNEQVMYIGPTLRGVAKSGAVFSGGFLKSWKSWRQKSRLLKI